MNWRIPACKTAARVPQHVHYPHVCKQYPVNLCNKNAINGEQSDQANSSNVAFASVPLKGNKNIAGSTMCDCRPRPRPCCRPCLNPSVPICGSASICNFSPPINQNFAEFYERISNQLHDIQTEIAHQKDTLRYLSCLHNLEGKRGACAHCSTKIVHQESANCSRPDNMDLLQSGKVQPLMLKTDISMKEIGLDVPVPLNTEVTYVPAFSPACPRPAPKQLDTVTNLKNNLHCNKKKGQGVNSGNTHRPTQKPNPSQLDLGQVGHGPVAEPQKASQPVTCLEDEWKIPKARPRPRHNLNPFQHATAWELQRPSSLDTKNRYEPLQNLSDFPPLSSKPWRTEKFPKFKKPRLRPLLSKGIRNQSPSSTLQVKDTRPTVHKVISDSMLIGCHHLNVDKHYQLETHSGSQPHQLRAKLEKIEPDQSIKTLILHNGTNSITTKTSAQIADNIYQLIRSAKKTYPLAKIAYTSIIYRTDVPDSIVDSVNEEIKWVCKELEATFVNSNKWISKLDLSRGGLHPNQQGNMKLHNMVLEIFSILEWRPCLEDASENQPKQKPMQPSIVTLTTPTTSRPRQYNIKPPKEPCPTIIERQGNLFEAPKPIPLVHCVAADLNMHKGIAASFKRKFGQADHLINQKREVGSFATLHTQGRLLIYLITKQASHHKPYACDLKASLINLRSFCKYYHIHKIAMPRIGCGLDKMYWPFVKSMLEDTFKKTSIQIIVYTPEKNVPEQSTIVPEPVPEQPEMQPRNQCRSKQPTIQYGNKPVQSATQLVKTNSKQSDIHPENNSAEPSDILPQKNSSEQLILLHEDMSKRPTTQPGVNVCNQPASLPEIIPKQPAIPPTSQLETWAEKSTNQVKDIVGKTSKLTMFSHTNTSDLANDNHDMLDFTLDYDTDEDNFIGFDIDPNLTPTTLLKMTHPFWTTPTLLKTP